MKIINNMSIEETDSEIKAKIEININPKEWQMILEKIEYKEIYNREQNKRTYKNLKGGKQCDFTNSVLSPTRKQ